MDEEKIFKKLIKLQKLADIWKIISSLIKEIILPAKAFPQAAILLKLLNLNENNIYLSMKIIQKNYYFVPSPESQ